MRINIYEEELTNEITITEKQVKDGPNTGKSFYGVRVYLKSAPQLHDTKDDDDRSAITFWVGEFSHAVKFRREIREVLLDIRGWDDVEDRRVG